MKVVWLCNVMLPRIAEALAKPPVNLGGWLVGLSNDLLGCEDMDLTVCVPDQGTDHTLAGSLGRLSYYAFPQTRADYTAYNPGLEAEFLRILQKEAPDVIHIFGTEYPHTLAMVRCAEKLGVIDRVVVNIQGLVSILATHYEADLPCKIIHGSTLKEWLKRSNLTHQRQNFERRGQFEQEALRRVRHVIGRTTWDRACALQINPEVQYHFCNETLRDAFYRHEWSREQCETHSIFISQSDYPIKGFHYMLEAMPEILRRFPEARIYTTGTDFVTPGSLLQWLRKSSYQRHLKKIIQKHGLQRRIVFLGSLGEQQMCERFLKSHAFVSSSILENSSNSICEAMLLGVPVVSSYVGGIPNLIEHGVSGYLYQHDAPYMLAHFVCSIFGDDSLARDLSRNARSAARELNNKATNLRTLLAIYESLSAP